jgi:hypothetical protein
MLPGDTQQLRHRLIPPVIQREPLQRPRRRTIAQPLDGLPRLHRVHSFQALNVPRPTDKTSPGRKSTCMTGLYYEMSRATGRNAAHCPGWPLQRQEHPTLSAGDLGQPSGPDGEGQAEGQARKARGEPLCRSNQADDGRFETNENGLPAQTIAIDRRG